MLSFYDNSNNNLNDEYNNIELKDKINIELNEKQEYIKEYKKEYNQEILDTKIECSICLDEIIYNKISFDNITDNQIPYITDCCKQNIHIYCFIEWLINCFDLYNYTRCPVCRNPISKDQIQEELSIALIIQFKLFKPHYTFKVYKFIHSFFPKYEIPHIIIEIDGYNYNLINSIENHNNDFINMHNHINPPRIQSQYSSNKSLFFVKIFIVATFIIGFTIILVTELLKNASRI